MAWIKFHKDTIEHPKTHRFTAALGVSHVTAVGHLVFFWRWCAMYARNGFISSPDLGYAVIDSLWTGEIQDFVTALIKAGFIDPVVDGDTPGYQLHDWDEHASHIVAKWHKEKLSERRLPAAEWNQLRLKIYARDNYTCQYCGARGVRLECDHVVPICQGGSNDEENLVAACFTCNRSKAGKTIKEWHR